METGDKIVTLESYYDPMLAHIVRTRLESNGIPCFIADDLTIGANPLFNQAIGGIKIKVFEHDLDKCREILATEGDLHEQDHLEVDDDNDTYVVCPHCGSNNVTHLPPEKSDDKWSDILNSLSNLVNPFHAEKHWHCNHCQQDFE